MVAFDGSVRSSPEISIAILNLMVTIQHLTQFFSGKVSSVFMWTALNKKAVPRKHSFRETTFYNMNMIAVPVIEYLSPHDEGPDFPTQGSP